MSVITKIITAHFAHYKLSELLQVQSSALHKELQLTIAQHCSVKLIDDLATSPITQFSLTIKLQKQSSLKLIGDLTCKHHIIERNVTIILNEKAAQADVLYQGIAKNDQIIKITTKQHHTTAHTTSNLAVKFVLKDQAKSTCNSLIYVDLAAEHVTAQQVNKNLLLSPLAVAVSSPKLEVLSHQVKCSHGAAMSHLDADKLFFLQSRGFETTKAQKILINAFLSS